MHFGIQIIDGEIVHDFSWTLIDALRYWKWRGDPWAYCLLSQPAYERSYIPVGSVEFVQQWLRELGYPEAKPRNVPVELFPFADRWIQNGTDVDLIKAPFWAKSNDVIKAEIQTPLAPGNYQFSGWRDFDSEWRAFVWRNELVGLQNYLGDFTLFPDVPRIRAMIEAFKPSAPCAYTLDVGICEGITSVVEVHDFFSCGLYGFADLQLLPVMLSGWYREYTRR